MRTQVGHRTDTTVAVVYKLVAARAIRRNALADPVSQPAPPDCRSNNGSSGWLSHPRLDHARRQLGTFPRRPASCSGRNRHAQAPMEEALGPDEPAEGGVR